MMASTDIFITGIGVVCPIGVGNEAFWNALLQGRSGVTRLPGVDGAGLPPVLGAQVPGFEPARWVRPRKALKVMSRDIQLAFVAAELACQQAGVGPGKVDPDRFGIVFGADMMPCELEELAPAYRQCMVNGHFDFGRWGTHALEEMFPLWMLKYLPNMPACHIGIAQDARGPNNTIVLGEVSSLAAMAEAARVLQRGAADIMIAGGAGCRIHPIVWSRRSAYYPAEWDGPPEKASRPFDKARCGQVFGEGAAAFVLERADHAHARGARPLAKLLGFASTFEPCPQGRLPTGQAIRRAIVETLRQAGMSPTEVGHVNAHGLSTRHDDRIEAQAIAAVLPDVPVTAPKSFFGNLAAGTGAVEAAASVLAIQSGFIPPTLNYEEPDPECPINVVAGKPAPLQKPTALCLNHTHFGQAMALLLAHPDF
ncbi:MAG: beta-ketoacyl-[acyl-carrier-protein] synthase family protein [Thermoguttaceae bacterium]|nr:beta-ketoacyl-[acyl-carrier-protein] synthase family protein [Thermoguttaceae bacterium]MDW8078577.1 beta-ketoacyl-[acyl-carrier-protein] synthase family protein [Thermoguttaceae bacterium]